MASEIRIGGSFSLVKGSQSIGRRIDAKAADQTGVGYVSGTQSIGFAAHEALDMGNVGTAGVCFFVNLDTLHFVEIGTDDTGTFEPLLKLLPGEMAVGRLATNASYAKADTAAVDLEYWILEA